MAAEVASRRLAAGTWWDPLTARHLQPPHNAGEPEKKAHLRSPVYGTRGALSHSVPTHATGASGPIEDNSVVPSGPEGFGPDPRFP